MGDILSLIDKVQAEVDEEKARDMERKLRKADFDFNDFLDQFAQLRKMGNIGDLMGMIPGMGSKMKGMEMPDDKSIKRIESIILSMTAQERSHPDIINPSRKRRIAAGAGVEVAEVNRLMKQFDQIQEDDEADVWHDGQEEQERIIQSSFLIHRGYRFRQDA